MKPYLIKDEVTEAEIICSLKTFMHHNSKRSGGSSSQLFPLVFANSAVAQNCLMHKDKLSYLITHGLGPFFQQNRPQDVKISQLYTVSFDEGLNEVAQKIQMDIVIRSWESLEHVLFTLCKVLTRQLIKRLAGKYTSFFYVSITIKRPSLLDIIWVENSTVLMRAIEMLQLVRKYVAAVEKHPPDSDACRLYYY
ncbi:hypothetical protein PR048_026582 [Dryococelus australis]|uniref:Uncharacterized protein n=1 Tax=Dryococelus australis TaxID=614101 RepID=A0ABQ9GLR5_9NEOP|nr:hypothetical protein PR048_026582 [Dryococelus australis]